MQNREHCWNTASLCDKKEAEEQKLSRGSNINSNNENLRGNGIAILRRVHRCLSSGAIPIPASMTIAPTSHPNASEPTFYQSYSCDDLYLASDLTPAGTNLSVSSQPIIQEGQQDQEADELVFDDVQLDNATNFEVRLI